MCRDEPDTALARAGVRVSRMSFYRGLAVVHVPSAWTVQAVQRRCADENVLTESHASETSVGHVRT